MGKSIAENYCRALVALAVEKKKVAAIMQSAAALLPVVKMPEVDLFLNHPSITAADKKELAVRFLARDTPQEFVNFLHLLIDRRRTRLLPELLDRTIDLAMKAQGYEVVNLITARELSAEEEASIRKDLETQWATKLFIKKRCNPNLIGGIIIKREDQLYDGSILGQLTSLRRKLTERSV
ncbi:MAG: ATP synthase F1 subunit delta [Bacillota bacterium]